MTAPANSPTTYVIGHKNPDADSICSALAYAAYKEARGERGHIAARCGNSNARIDAILARFRQPLPLYLNDVSPRVRDLMAADVVSVSTDATCAEALDLLDRHKLRVLPVTSSDRHVTGTLSLAHLGGIFIPRASEPRLMRQVHTSLGHIARALKARVLHAADPGRLEELYIRLGTMATRSFWKVSELEQIPADRSLIIVGDRREIQLRAIELGVRALIITSNLPVDDDVLASARARGIGLLVSPHDSATTAWVVRAAATIQRVVEPRFASVHPDARVADIRRKFPTLDIHTPAFMVIDEAGALVGVLSKGDLLKPATTRLVLVDHNELSQAVAGADQVNIVEIIDHHRLGSLHTPQPILFINEPVGSTCTIIADLFRRESLQPSPEIAGIMMSGLISDTLHLKGPTTTGKDALMLAWLSEIAGVDSKQLANEIFNSGSVILANPPEKIVRSDHKVYEEEGVRFAVSQVEELGFANFWEHAKPIAAALSALREEERLAFAALLVTDINTQNSLLLVKGDPTFIQRINHVAVEENEIFDLPGIVSRKKQLVPYLTSLLREITADGLTLTTSGKTGSPFSRG
jgi:manganese-dependent inorganic pyrophosphatase